MVRKRGALDRIEKVTKKRSRSNLPQISSPTVKKERNLLNDRILSLYKQGENSVKDKSPLLENKKEKSLSDSANEEFETSQKPESSKICGKVVKSTEKKKSSFLALKYSTIKFEDVGGLKKILSELLRLFSHIKDPEFFVELGVRPLGGLLLHGSPGCGKTHLARAIAGELNLPYMEVAATELVCGISGESESKIRDMFDEALRSAPCILFIDEIDAISPKRETSDRGMERRMVAQLLKCLDELVERDTSARVMVIGATNRPDFIDPALRRGGRFEKEVAIGMPDEAARLQILKVLCKKLKLASNFDMEWLAHHTPGYVGADLNSLITGAVDVGVWRIYSKYIKSGLSATKADGDSTGISVPLTDCKQDSELPLELVQLWFESDMKIPKAEYVNIYFELQDFQDALQKCVPYSKREGFSTVPDVTWDDVGALEDTKNELQSAILWPVKYGKSFESSHLTTTKGILLYGPKGCGKTLLAKAIANECSINFLSVKGPELLSMYLGESEKAVRQCFQRAKNSAPCVIFFDEIDALCPSRSGSNVNAAADRVVNQLLTEMDGMEVQKQVFVVGATNRLEKLDSAIIRPGRFEKIIFVDIPSPAGRVEILKRLTKNKTRPKIAVDVDLETVGLDSRCENFSGADLAYLIRESSSKAMSDHIRNSSLDEIIEIKMEHFEQAFSKVKPSITKKETEYFRSLVHRS